MPDFHDRRTGQVNRVEFSPLAPDVVPVNFAGRRADGEVMHTDLNGRLLTRKEAQKLVALRVNSMKARNK